MTSGHKHANIGGLSWDDLQFCTDGLRIRVGQGFMNRLYAGVNTHRLSFHIDP